MLIIGSRDDPHVAAVVERVGAATVVDASTLDEQTYALDLCSFAVADQVFGSERPSRGWIRRLAPPAWSHRIEAGSRPAVAQSASVSMLAAIARTPGIEWLTDLDALMIGESKIVQMRAASELGIRTPASLVTNSSGLARARLGRYVVIKPLGPGTFTQEDGSEAIVYATRVDLESPTFADLGPTPFLIQEVLDTLQHHRVVTVCDRYWVTSLDATDLPLDWRSEERAHHSFRHEKKPPQALGVAAVELAERLRLRYSSQDWVRTRDGSLVALDVNPSGQWAFLPEPVTEQVTEAIATWLQGRPYGSR